MKSGINKAAFILLFVFLTGCGREELPVSTETEEIEDTLNLARCISWVIKRMVML